MAPAVSPAKPPTVSPEPIHRPMRSTELFMVPKQGSADQLLLCQFVCRQVETAPTERVGWAWSCLVAVLVRQSRGVSESSLHESPEPRVADRQVAADEPDPPDSQGQREALPLAPGQGDDNCYDHRNVRDQANHAELKAKLAMDGIDLDHTRSSRHK